MKTLHWILLICAAVLVAFWALQKGPAIQQIGYTTESPKNARIEASEGTVDGEIVLSHNTQTPVFVPSRQVPAQVGVTFGFWIEYPRSMFSKSLRGSVTHPPMGPENVTQQTWPIMKKAFSDALLVGYLIEDDFELVPGDWTFAVWDGDRKLFEQTLMLVAPNALP